MSLIYKEGQYYGKGGTEMPAEDMAEVASPMPSVMSRLPILFDESGAERVVGWYKYANGTKKPVYEKMLKNITCTSATGEQILYTQADADLLYVVTAFSKAGDKYYQLPSIPFNSLTYGINIFGGNDATVRMQCATNRTNYNPFDIIIRYTKTTD